MSRYSSKKRHKKETDHSNSLKLQLMMQLSLKLQLMMQLKFTQAQIVQLLKTLALWTTITGACFVTGIAYDRHLNTNPPKQPLILQSIVTPNK